MGNYLAKITQTGLGKKKVVVKQELMKNASLVNVNLINPAGQQSPDPFFSSVKTIAKAFGAGGSLVGYGYHWGRLDALEELKKLEAELKRRDEKLGELEELTKLEDEEKLGEVGELGRAAGGDGGYAMDPPFV